MKDLKYCKHCKDFFVRDAVHWYKNGGKFSKCKLFYTKYEQERSRERPKSTKGKVRKALKKAIERLGTPVEYRRAYRNDGLYCPKLALTVLIVSENCADIERVEARVPGPFVTVIYGSDGSCDFSRPLAEVETRLRDLLD